jgi:hypothetical protein
LFQSLEQLVESSGVVDGSESVQKALRLPPHRHWLISVVDQFVLDLFQKSLHSAFLNGSQPNPINSWGSVVTLGHLVGFLKRFHLADVNV